MSPSPCDAPAGTVATSAMASIPDMVAIEAGTFLMGTDDARFPADREGPVREVHVEAFSISPRPVTNDDWAAFVDATGFTTLAERQGWSYVFAGLLPDDFPDTRGVVGAPWWRQAPGADWRHPYGPHSDLDGLGEHPVVHVTWHEATAYARWARARLPTEAEWEKAARGGLRQAVYAWGDELTPDGEHRCNIWQGTFPTVNTLADGWLATSPVGAYPPNGFGLHDVAGNVWEWTGDRFDEADKADEARRALRGGSYLCHDSYCNRYRVAARSSNTAGSATGNIGFRVAAG